MVVTVLLLARAAFGDTFYDGIGDAVERTHSQVRDVNYDGEVDCVDWSRTFKEIWENEHGPGTCILVENHNTRTGMHHMLVKVRIDGYMWEYVEPQGTRDNWQPYDIWGDKYRVMSNRDVP